MWWAPEALSLGGVKLESALCFVYLTTAVDASSRALFYFLYSPLMTVGLAAQWAFYLISMVNGGEWRFDRQCYGRLDMAGRVLSRLLLPPITSQPCT